MGNRMSGLDIENLRRTVAASRDVAAVQAEPHTTNNTLVRKVVDQVNVEHAAGTGVEHGEPVTALLLQVLGQLLDVEISEDVALCQRDL